MISASPTNHFRLAIALANWSTSCTSAEPKTLVKKRNSSKSVIVIFARNTSSREIGMPIRIEQFSETYAPPSHTIRYFRDGRLPIVRVRRAGLAQTNCMGHISFVKRMVTVFVTIMMAAVLAPAHVQAQITNRVVVPSTAFGTITVIDTMTNAVVG